MSGDMAAPKKRRPSERWTSFDDWNYGGMRQRLEGFMASISKAALTEHASVVLGSPASMSEPFSAGQHWCCFELVAPDDRFLVARVRLPKHPESNATDTDEEYLIQCEVATMSFLRANVRTVPLPELYAYEAPGSTRAINAGATYMLIQGFYGNSLQDIDQSIYDLPVSTQEHVFAQWTSVQAELAAFTFPQIGSISQFSTDTGPTIGAIATASIDGLPAAGPFRSGWDYFVAVAEGLVADALQRKRSGTESSQFATLGPLVFRNIVRDTHIFKSKGPFHLNHMDMGMQNILIDDGFNFVAVIDWELAHSAPWEVNHYPMPIPLISSDRGIAEILYDPRHMAHRNVSRQAGARLLYRQKFEEAERALEKRGKPLHYSIAEVLDGKASRIYGLVEKIGVFHGMEEELTYELVRLGYGLTGPEAEQHLQMLGGDERGDGC
ncbi:hypothetical protein GGTG_08528 [Gaeumannomyces tritici R3-111a-1]|uniref:Uncharacterized protein n=1 Tax=Gaeumannomyces tritici (strain R3-111a-1) TaxID=644352 RepID=J3P4U2_GAET3|nr:hypothetical protein GGTG_08528 [Gaeumannomyces tritici R3-111a-1]EJT74690.1 hypothetical protein GGTG_08528 [Gaeumannomyces tritici R3-111a-1]